MTKSVAILAGIVATFLAGTAHAVVIDFEGFAATGGLVNVSPATPYAEDGFTITPTDSQSAVFDSSAASDMPGNLTDWFGFAESNTPTLTLTSGGTPFSMQSALIGPSTVGAGTVNITITGNQFGGGTVSQTFNNLLTATAVTLNFNNLASVVFRTSDDAGLDNIAVQLVPEPSTLLLIGIGAISLIGYRKAKSHD